MNALTVNWEYLGQHSVQEAVPPDEVMCKACQHMHQDETHENIRAQGMQVLRPSADV